MEYDGSQDHNLVSSLNGWGERLGGNSVFCWLAGGGGKVQQLTLQKGRLLTCISVCYNSNNPVRVCSGIRTSLSGLSELTHWLLASTPGNNLLLLLAFFFLPLIALSFFFVQHIFLFF